MRAQQTIIALKDKFHFCGGKLKGLDIWFPYSGDLFEAVERVLIANGEALNLSNMEKVRECGPSIDYRIEYNA